MNGLEGYEPKPRKTVITQTELKCLLEILRQTELEGRAATNRIACELCVKPPTVCGILDRLLSKQMINREPYGKINLTEEGRKITCSMRTSVNEMQKVVMRQLNLNAQSAFRTALFFACQMDEDSRKAIVSCAREQ